MEVPMPTVLAILMWYKEATKARFLEVMHRTPAPPKGPLPVSPEEALKLGIMLGRREGYEEGLVAGTQLGLDVGWETAEALLCQPVVFGPVGLA